MTTTKHTTTANTTVEQSGPMGEPVFRIEESVKVYLLFNPDRGRWELDPITCDGHALDGLPEGGDCDSHYQHLRSDPETRHAHQAAHNAADAASLPDAREVLTMLAEHFHLDLIDSQIIDALLIDLADREPS